MERVHVFVDLVGKVAVFVHTVQSEKGLVCTVRREKRGLKRSSLVRRHTPRESSTHCAHTHLFPGLVGLLLLVALNADVSGEFTPSGLPILLAAG